MIKTEIKLTETTLKRMRPTEKEIMELLISYRKAELKARLDKIKI